jgi:hypothetical protein
LRKLEIGFAMALPFVEEKVGDDGKVEYVPAKSTLIDLYKYYEGVGNQARGQMVVTVNWLLSFAIGVLVYSAQNAIEITAGRDICRTNDGLAVIAPIAGLGLCLLALVTIREFREHVMRNWMRANRCKILVDDLYRLVSGAPVAPSDKTEWPATLKSSTVFQKHERLGETRSRVSAIFDLYRRFSLVLVALFAVALVLFGGIEGCQSLSPATLAS